MVSATRGRLDDPFHDRPKDASRSINRVGAFVGVTVASIQVQVRRGAFHDSVVLMQLQKALMTMPQVMDAGVVMGTEANKQVLRQSDLLTQDALAARAEDLVVSVRAETPAAARAAIDQVESLLARRAARADSEFRPRSLESALKILPQAQWVLVSVPGRYAAGVARAALAADRNVFLYSDNVPLPDEIELKRTARQKGLLVMGPDCGTAIVGGASLGFANHVRRGRIGVVGASGTGTQAVTVYVHNRGAGISHAIGTGTHDLSAEVGAMTVRQGLDLLSGDARTDVIVLISKPPSPSVVQATLSAARAAGKPVVVDFIGYEHAAARDGNLYFAGTLSEAAEIATRLAPPVENTAAGAERRPTEMGPVSFAPGQQFLRGLYSGGTLAYEAQLILRDSVGDVYSNAPLNPAYGLVDPAASRDHTVLDLGADEFTVGRLHPMLDNDLRIRRLRQEAEDPLVAVLLLDVVLGYGSHPDPAAELAPAIARAIDTARQAGRRLLVIAAVVGTDEDPQGLEAQTRRLADVGAIVETDHAAAVRLAAKALRGRAGEPQRRIGHAAESSAEAAPLPVAQSTGRVDKSVLDRPFAAINIGLESFYASLSAQGFPVVQVEWRPPAGGDEKLIAVLERLKRASDK